MRKLTLACALMFGAANAQAQQAPPVVPPPATVVQPSLAPLLVPPKKAPPPPAPVSAASTPRISAPAAAQPMKREGLPPDSVRPASNSKAAVMPLRPTTPPPAPQSAAARIATANRSVAPASIVPIGATMRCKDGAYLTGTPSADRCANNGGVAATYPTQPSPPAPKPKPQRKQP